ncbi:hypothetical protein ACTXGL_13090 [Psychrobacter sp. T6-6]|uniref:hypothetical protein n=1 Tax=Psychrobacter sp. T6-6 TaxID=3457452 RepID=UPI003FD2BEAE
MTEKTREERFDLFQYWLMDLSDALNRFIDSKPLCIRDKLDYSIESLDIIENYLLSQYSHNNEIIQEPADILNGYSIYVGETFRKVLRDKTDRDPNTWKIELDDVDYVFYNLPIIKVGAYTGCPRALVTACLDRRKGNYFSKILMNQIK